MRSIAWLLAFFVFAATGAARPVEGAFSTDFEAPAATIEMDLGGSGQTILFVEVGSSKQQCLCQTAKAMASFAHARIIKIGDDDPAQASLQNFLKTKLAAEDQACIVAAGDTYDGCRAAVAEIRGKSSLALFDAEEELSLGAAPEKIALDVISFIAANKALSQGNYDKPHGDRWWHNLKE